MEPPTLLILVRDLLSLAPIRAALASKAKAATFIRDPAHLPGIDIAQVTHVIADLNLPNAIPALSQLKAKHTQIQITGFVSHTDSESIRLAREAGVDKVLARSAFFKDPASFLE